MNENQQEIMFKLSFFEQQIKQVQEQVEAVEKGISDLNTLNFALDDIKGSKDKEILAPIGRGIFLKAKLLSEDLIVDIGGRNFVKKTAIQTQEVLDKQTDKLENIKKNLQKNLDEITFEIEKAIQSAKDKD